MTRRFPERGRHGSIRSLSTSDNTLRPTGQGPVGVGSHGRIPDAAEVSAPARPGRPAEAADAAAGANSIDVSARRRVTPEPEQFHTRVTVSRCRATNNTTTPSA
ncbi:hypothetical protein [Actinopolyspora mortivallis]|uniref:hypothetical protein n=1 Tax=Actinopolyspora mortivallis TaxID=33906 RepID=UPI00146B19C6|nr:hypothetical protein [Actinopolyspora mortivallis]